MQEKNCTFLEHCINKKSRFQVAMDNKVAVAGQAELAWQVTAILRSLHEVSLVKINNDQFINLIL